MKDLDERIRGYLRSRADVPVPDDLRWPSRADKRSFLTSLRSAARWAGLAAVIVTGIVVAVTLTRATRSDSTDLGPATSLPPPTDAVSSPPGSEFPPRVAGMQVVSVAQAVQLINRGELDGRAVAVAGYFFEAVPSCPAPLRYVSSLENFCRFVTLADDPASATLCTHSSNAVTCGPPSGTHLAPFFMAESTGQQPFTPDDLPVPVVLIGHVGDARAWQCAPDQQRACQQEFVVDRLVWASGHEMPFAAPQPFDGATGKALVPQMTVEEASAAIGPGQQVLTADAFRGRDIATVDPRWNLSGDSIFWIVRSIREGDSGSQSTVPVTVSLVADATGTLVGVHDLALSASYRPARLWTIATTENVPCCAGDILPFYRIQSVDGTSLHDGLIEGGEYGRESTTTYGPGVPALLSPGTYSITVWLATFDRGVVGPPADTCSTQVTLSALDDLMVDAVFPAAGKACAFGQPSAPKLSH